MEENRNESPRGAGIREEEQDTDRRSEVRGHDRHLAAFLDSCGRADGRTIQGRVRVGWFVDLWLEGDQRQRSADDPRFDYGLSRSFLCRSDDEHRRQRRRSDHARALRTRSAVCGAEGGKVSPEHEDRRFVILGARSGVLYLRSRSEEHTSELQSLRHLVCRLLLEKKKNKKYTN